jgi:CheY-like chemotaxis protein
MFIPDPDLALWCLDAVQCVLVPDGPAVMVELRNASGAAFLRKFTPTVQAAMNEAEYLRLLLHGGDRRMKPGALKPFALVIEENRYDCDALIETLKTSGMRAFGCRTGAEGVCVAREISPDVIVMNHELSDVGGLDVCRMLREGTATAGIPIIVLTTDPDRLRAEGCVADAVLTRPCPSDTLAAATRLFVRHLTFQQDDSW